ncbi:hypothetical protein EBR03_08715 [bacterium]|nr:hypothetical protein [bacterium]
MIDKQKKELERAKELFFSWQLHEAYAIFRRFFDRLPFAPQTEHALYLSFFIRCMLELGKERELDFYLNQIETLSNKWRTPELRYQLAEASLLGPTKNKARAKALLNEVIADPQALHLHVKAKMFLAYCYDLEGADIASCKQIIDSIPDSEDRVTQLNVELWRIKIIRDSGQPESAETQLKKFIAKIDPKRDWYAYFSAKILLGGVFILLGKIEEAQFIIAETQKLVEASPFRTPKVQLKALEEKLNVAPPVPEFLCEQGIRSWRLSFQKKSIEIKHQTGAAKLFELFCKKEWVDKNLMAKKLLKKEYVPTEDDNRIHFQVHTLRKILLELEAGSDPISFEDGGYRMIPRLIIREGEI